jgi:hypothetical protein
MKNDFQAPEEFEANSCRYVALAQSSVTNSPNLDPPTICLRTDDQLSHQAMGQARDPPVSQDRFFLRRYDGSEANVSPITEPLS